MIHPIAFHPDFFPPSADEMGSTRYECMIMYVKLPHQYYSCKIYDIIEEEGVLLILERSPDYKAPVDIDYKSGVAVRGPRGDWSWWFHLNQKGAIY